MACLTLLQPWNINRVRVRAALSMYGCGAAGIGTPPHPPTPRPPPHTHAEKWIVAATDSIYFTGSPAAHNKAGDLSIISPVNNPPTPPEPSSSTFPRPRPPVRPACRRARAARTRSCVSAQRVGRLLDPDRARWYGNFPTEMSICSLQSLEIGWISCSLELQPGLQSVRSVAAVSSLCFALSPRFWREIGFVKKKQEVPVLSYSNSRSCKERTRGGGKIIQIFFTCKLINILRGNNGSG